MYTFYVWIFLICVYIFVINLSSLESIKILVKKFTRQNQFSQIESAFIFFTKTQP